MDLNRMHFQQQQQHEHKRLGTMQRSVSTSSAIFSKASTMIMQQHQQHRPPLTVSYSYSTKIAPKCFAAAMIRSAITPTTTTTTTNKQSLSVVSSKNQLTYRPSTTTMAIPRTPTNYDYDSDGHRSYKNMKTSTHPQYRAATSSTSTSTKQFSVSIQNMLLILVSFGFAIASIRNFQYQMMMIQLHRINDANSRSLVYLVNDNHHHTKEQSSNKRNADIRYYNNHYYKVLDFTKKQFRQYKHNDSYHYTISGTKIQINKVEKADTKKLYKSTTPSIPAIVATTPNNDAGRRTASVITTTPTSKSLQYSSSATSRVDNDNSNPIQMMEFVQIQPNTMARTNQRKQTLRSSKNQSTLSKSNNGVINNKANGIEKLVATTTSSFNMISASGSVLCIQSPRWYGRTFNRILELANALALIHDKSNNTSIYKGETMIGLAPNLSEWYTNFLDERPDIILNYTGSCASIWTSKDLFFIKEYKNTIQSRYQLQSLIPKHEFRNEAELAMQQYRQQQQQQEKNKLIITVHRRDLEGGCDKKAMITAVACVNDKQFIKRSMSTNDLLDTCHYDYNMIYNKHKSEIEQNTSTIILCTDQQVPKYDTTFPIVSNYSFPVEAWMMTLSDVHYGNPHSTVDLVVAVWRTGQQKSTHPEACYVNKVTLE